MKFLCPVHGVLEDYHIATGSSGPACSKCGRAVIRTTVAHVAVPTLKGRIVGFAGTHVDPDEEQASMAL